jgi:hypothetical protein
VSGSAVDRAAGRRPRRQVGQQARELAARVPERAAQLDGSTTRASVLERLDERPVRRAHDGVAGAVEDERAVAGGLGANSRTRRLLPEPGSPPSSDDAAALARGRGMSARSVSSSASARRTGTSR